MNTLYAEVIGCVVAASVLGLFAGWMMHRARAARALASANALWELKYDKLKSRTNDDTATLETRLQSLGDEIQSLTGEKRAFEQALAERDAAIEHARQDAVELNRQQAGIQERLQRIIRGKDKKLASLGVATDEVTTTAPPSTERSDAASIAVAAGAGAAGIAGVNAPANASLGDEVEPYIDRQSDRGEAHRIDTRAVADSTPARSGAGAFADTDEVPTVGTPSYDDSLEATVLMDLDVQDIDDVTATQILDPMDATEPDAAAFDEDESTIAFDEETLARMRGRSGVRD